MLTGHKTKPGSHVPPILELSAITNGGHDGSRRFGADAPYFGDTLTDLAGLEHRFDLLVEAIDAQIEITQQIPQLADRLPGHRGQFISLVGQYFREHAPGAGDGFAKGDAPVE
jgi:hypothetical protein